MSNPIFRSGLFVPALFAALVAFGAGTSRAGIVFELGNKPQADQENVLLDDDDTGSTVFGETNKSEIKVSFTSATDRLLEPSNGQARVAAKDGLLNDITISVPGGTFTSLIVNPFYGSGTAILTAVLNKVGGGTYTSTYSYDLGKGQNFVTVLASGGETIQSLTIDAAKGFTDLRQPRITASLNGGCGGGGGITPEGGVVPEPASVAMSSFAIGVLGLAWLRKRNLAA